MAFGRLGSVGAGFGRLGNTGSGGAVAAAVGGGALLTGEANGFATDFTHAVDGERVAVKTAGVVVASGLDAFYSNSGTSPKQVFDVSGNLVWSPHNMVIQSAMGRPGFLWTVQGATGTGGQTDPSGGMEGLEVVTTVNGIGNNVSKTVVGLLVGQSYTASAWCKGTNGQQVYFNIDGSVPGQLLVTFTGSWQQVSKTWTATGTSSIMAFELYNRSGGAHLSNVTFQCWGAQYARGSTTSTYLPTTTTARYGLALDYDPVTHAPKGLLVEPAATNLLLNSTTLSTQSVTVTAVAHTLSFLGTGTVTLTGVSTAGPLVGTGASNRVSLTFTPTAGSLTCTVSGTVSNAQLEIGTVATSPIPTFAATATRAADNYTFLLSTIPALGAEWSLYCRYATPSVSSSRHVVAVTDGTLNEFVGLRTNVFPNLNVVDGGVSQVNQNNGTLVADAFISTAARIKLNDFSMSSNGLAVTGDVAATLPTVTEVRFGGTGNNGVAVGLYRIQKLMLVPRAWDDATLVAKSAT